MTLLTRIAAHLGYTPTPQASAAQTRAAAQAHDRAMTHAAQHHRNLLAALTTPDVASWAPTGQHVNAHTVAGLSTIRARSKTAAYDNPYASRYINMCLRNILGPRGVVYQSRVRTQAGNLKDTTNEVLESGWTVWSKPDSCSPAGRLNWRMHNRVALRHVITDGEIFVRMLPGRGPHAFQIQLIPASAVPIDYRADLPGGTTIRQGIERNAEGRFLAAYVRVADLQDTPIGLRAANPHQLLRIPADHLLHIGLDGEAGQLRFLPWLTTGLKPAYQANDFAQAGLNKARESAKRGGWIEQDPDYIPPQSPVNIANDDPNTAPLVPPTTLADNTWDTLPAGYTAKPYQSDYPNIEYGQFIRDALHQVACGFDVPYMDLANDYSDINYSSGQLGREDVKQLWLELQQWWLEHFIQPIHGAWLKHALIAAPELVGLSYARQSIYAAGAAWQCHRWQPLDPAKTINARREAIALRLTSPQRLLIEDGEDPDEVLADLAAWQQKLAALGLDLQAAQPGQPSLPHALNPTADNNADPTAEPINPEP